MTMPYKLEVAPADQTLSYLEALVRQWEQRNFEVITLAVGVVDGRPANLLTLARRAAPQAISLAVVDGSLSIQAQESAVNASAGARTLVWYAGVYVEGRIAAVVAYRG